MILYSRLNRVIAVLSLLLCVSVATEGQIRQTHRFEVERKNSDEYYNVISLEDEGLALLQERNKYEGNKRLWEVTLLDTALQLRKVVGYHIEERFPMIGYEVTPGHLYLLYRMGETNKNGLKLVDINTADMTEGERYEIKPELEFKITHFSKVGTSIALGGYVSNDPAIILYDMVNKSIKVVPGFFQKDNELVDLRVNQNNTFNVILIDRSQRSDRKLVFRTFDEAGKLLLEDVVPIDGDKSLQTSISSTLEREELMVLGTWGDRTGKQSSGFFSMAVDPFKDQSLNFYHFGELEHFLDYLNPKRAERIKNNTRQDLEHERRPSFTSYVIPFRIEETRDGYLLLAEVYHPVSTPNSPFNNPAASPYASSPYYFYNPYWPYYYPGMRYRRYAYGDNVKNSDEIRTYETVLVSFDGTGKIKWDQSIKLDDIEKQGLEQVSDFVKTRSGVVFLYKKESSLKIRLIDTDDDVAQDSEQKIKLDDPLDELRNEKEFEGGLQAWVGNTLYVWGYQTIRNQQRKDNRVRDVFYVNKIVVD